MRIAARDVGLAMVTGFLQKAAQAGIGKAHDLEGYWEKWVDGGR
jgi:hypothetical protein